MYLKNFLKESFYKSPEILKKLYSILPHSITFGDSFREDKRILAKAKHEGDSFIKDIINKRFMDTVSIAFNKIPFYKNLYSEYGVSENQIKSIDDISLLPIIDKSMLKNSSLKTYNDKISQVKFIKANTGGSSGNPFSFFLPSNRYYRAWAYKVDMWGRAGYSFGQNVLSLRGHQFKKKLVELQPLYNFHYVDSTKLNARTVQSLHNYMQKNKIKFLHGYPSNITRFLELFLAEDLDINFIKGILPVSEQLLPSQINLIKSTINDVKIQPSYEQSEMTVLATTSGLLNEYDFYPTYGYPEIIDVNNKISSEGRLIGTSFNNPIMPLIRYETGDQVSTVRQSEVSFLPPKVSISGRIGEYIYFNDSKHSLTGIIYGNHLPIFSIVNKLQIYQKDDYLALVFSSSEHDLNQKILKETYNIMLKNTKGFLKIELIQVKSDIKTGAGKYKLKITDKEFESLDIIRKY